MRADHAAVLRLLKTARGQIDGIIKMVEEDQYCIDIMNQIMASEAVLRKTNKVVLQGHISGCVMDTFHSTEQEREKKMTEMLDLLDKIYK